MINAEAVRQRLVRARRALHTWRDTAQAAWKRASDASREGLGHEVDILFLGADGNRSLALAYVKELDEQLGDVRNAHARLRQQHARTYGERFARYQEVAERRQWSEQPQPNASGANPTDAPPTASPTLPGVPLAGGSGPQGSSAAGNPTPGAGPEAALGLDEKEYQVTAGLVRRVSMLKRQRPQPAQLIAASAMAAPALWLIVLALLDPSGVVSLPLALTLAAAITLLTGGISLGYTMLADLWIKRAEKDMLGFLRLCFVYRCERYEDQLRVSVLGPVTAETQKMRARLEDDQFLADIAQSLSASAHQTEASLLDSSSFYRDVLMGNGRRLDRGQSQNLQWINNEVAKRRREDPVEPWHRDPSLMGERLCEFLLSDLGVESVLLLDGDVLLRQIRAFAYEINARYIVDTSRAPTMPNQKPAIGRLDTDALHRNDVWQRAMNRADQLSGAIGTPKPLFYVAASADNMGIVPQGIFPGFTHFSRTDSNEWIAVGNIWFGAGIGTLSQTPPPSANNGHTPDLSGPVIPDWAE